jgi:hypothetical protein
MNFAAYWWTTASSDMSGFAVGVSGDRARSAARTLYTSESGPIAPLDILYGHRPSLAGGKHHMAHKCGFTYSALSSSFFSSGFRKVFGGRRPQAFDL